MSAVDTAGPTPPVEPVEPDEDGIRIARRATGLLAEFSAAGVLSPADVAVARRLGHLGGEDAPDVLLAAALTVRALRAGSVCVDLTEVADADQAVLGREDAVVPAAELPWPDLSTWTARCAASPLAAPGGPLRVEDGLLYLDRYFRQEEFVRRDLHGRVTADPPVVDPSVLGSVLDRLFPAAEADPQQRLACAVAALRRVGIVAGGPGTGKTTTIARLLATLRALDPAVRIALAAPTGKAAARLQEAVAHHTPDDTPEDTAATAPRASTIHRLLGPLPDTRSRFRYDRDRHLPHDVVVVDETSMVSLTLMARLLEAVRPTARLVLVGDPDQLASVEAGAVLGDLVSMPGDPEPDLDAALAAAGCPVAPDDAPRNGVVHLRSNHRSVPAIAALADRIRAGDTEGAVAALRAGDSPVEFIESDGLEARDPAGLDALRHTIVAAARTTVHHALEGNVPAALDALDEHRLLCAHRRGPYGVTRWAAQVERWLAEDGVLGEPDEQWWAGRPLLVTGNDHDLGLYNGDTGVVVHTPEGPRAVFSRGGDPVERAPALLDQVQTVHAMTVHRAQGSQFTEVTVVLPPPESPLLTRELLYTAVTRARHRVRLVGSADAVRAAVARPISRASGFARRSRPAADTPDAAGGSPIAPSG